MSFVPGVFNISNILHVFKLETCYKEHMTDYE